MPVILLTEKKNPKALVEQFQSVLNHPSTIFDAAIACLPQVEINADLDLPPTPQETISALQQLSNKKTPGSHATPAEIYENGGR
ncbi:unnamed protein product [Dibothriocephalus latus]|uniref:Uncharacterized protein n=1 Tax=Dibothriocephalus latus TaxID=60516 RepID=A0A3P6UX07_DIBLA|nr:unnamed protein product [Dibothriocephalus latus]